MTHRSARRSLSALLDGDLAPADETALRRHLDLCAACRRALRELEAAEMLLRRMPASLLPLDIGREAELRLRALARWVPERPTPSAGWRAPALGALAAALVLLVWTHTLRPPGIASTSTIVVAARSQASFLVPIPDGEGLPYSWRQ